MAGLLTVPPTITRAVAGLLTAPPTITRAVAGLLTVPSHHHHYHYGRSPDRATMIFTTSPHK